MDDEVDREDDEVDREDDEVDRGFLRLAIALQIRR